MASAAAIEGIGVHGLRWRHRINLGTAPARIGQLNDAASDGQPVDDKEVEALAEAVVAAARRFVESNLHLDSYYLSEAADSLEASADCGLEEVNHAMGELYDALDFCRILVIR